jgi:hypothetical protein
VRLGSEPCSERPSRPPAGYLSRTAVVLDMHRPDQERHLPLAVFERQGKMDSGTADGIPPVTAYSVCAASTSTKDSNPVTRPDASLLRSGGCAGVRVPYPLRSPSRGVSAGQQPIYAARLVIAEPPLCRHALPWMCHPSPVPPGAPRSISRCVGRSRQWVEQPVCRYSSGVTLEPGPDPARLDRPPFLMR